MKVKISLLEDIKDTPWDLLLLADPSKELIEEYLSRGQCFVISIHNEIVGVFVLIRTRPDTMELVNVAVRDDFQGKGIGKQLVLSAVGMAKEQGAKTIEIGTGNSSMHQLALYQKCGFRIIGVDRDFFIRHYEEEIYENGIQCIDMIRLSLDV